MPSCRHAILIARDSRVVRGHEGNGLDDEVVELMV